METSEIGRIDFIKEIGMIEGSGLLLTSSPWLQSFASETQKELKGEKARIALSGQGPEGYITSITC